jgi:hypothetical protein
MGMEMEKEKRSSRKLRLGSKPEEKGRGGEDRDGEARRPAGVHGRPARPGGMQKGGKKGRRGGATEVPRWCLDGPGAGGALGGGDVGRGARDEDGDEGCLVTGGKAVKDYASGGELEGIVGD